jgi:hypothetical protein
MANGQSVADALAGFRRSNGIPHDEAARLSWSCRLGPASIRLPNFRWRQRALVAHDVHHMLTGYPCTMRGECQMAAWEFGAGGMSHWAARLFCQPLVLLGLAWSPRRVWNAFMSGRQSRSLHGIDPDRILAASVDELRSRVGARSAVLGWNGVRFVVLVAEAALIVSMPAMFGLGFVIWAGW